MFKYKIAILVDSFQNTETNKQIIQEISNKQQYDVTIFTISKENIIASPLAVFNISDYFNWSGLSIITSQKTLEKTISYPVAGPHVILGNVKYKDYFNISNLNLDLLNNIIINEKN